MISTYGIRKWFFSDLLFILNNNIIIFESKYIEIANFIEYGKKRFQSSVLGNYNKTIIQDAASRIN